MGFVLALANPSIATASGSEHPASVGIRIDIEELRQRQLDAIEALQEGRCDYALTRYHLADYQITSASRALLRAHLHWRGLCFEQDSAQTAHFLDLALGYNPRDSKAMALLGALYWRGDGVPMDQAKARTLFHRAMLEAGPGFIANEHSNVQGDGDTAAYRYWHLTDNDLDRGFTVGQVGFWDLPAPLQDELAWFDSIKSDGAKVTAIAFSLRAGTDGYPKDPVLAFQWMEAASLHLDFGPSHFPAAQWLRDEDLFRQRAAETPVLRQHRFRDYGFANLALLRAARFGDARADREILRLLKAGPDYENRNGAVYYWLLRLKSHGESIAAQDIESAKADVEPEMRPIIEKWDEARVRDGKSPEPYDTRLPNIP
jgi:hypothetical protein